MQKSIPDPQGSSRLGSLLRRHLVAVLILKAIFLAALWLAFIKPYRVSVDASVMGDRIAGQTKSTNQENKNDRFSGR
jgi:hypothetical protein